MRKQVLIFGAAGGVLITLLQWTDFHFLVLEHSITIYSFLLAVLFAAVGIWLGSRLFAPQERVVHQVVDRIVEVEVPVPAVPVSSSGAEDDTRERMDTARERLETARQRLGITRREMEILEHVARGLSNREIGEALFVSENTVKTHCSRAFDKLGARRRTEAVQRSKDLGLIS